MSPQLLAGILAGESPFNLTSCRLAPLFPGSRFGLQGVLTADPASEALPLQNPDFNLRHVPPTGLPRRIVKFNPS